MKMDYEKPTYVVLGDLFELTGSSGYDNDDGWGTDNCA